MSDHTLICGLCDQPVIDLSAAVLRADEWSHTSCVKRFFPSWPDTTQALVPALPAVPVIGFRLLHDHAHVPTRTHSDDWGWDVYAPRGTVLFPGRRELVGLGLAVELPPGLAFSLRPRSGVTRRGIWVAYGSIDTGYRGEIAVELHNLTAFSYAISVGDRIAQLVLARVVDCTWEERETLGATSRGEGGFGGSGK